MWKLNKTIFVSDYSEVQMCVLVPVFKMKNVEDLNVLLYLFILHGTKLISLGAYDLWQPNELDWDC